MTLSAALLFLALFVSVSSGALVTLNTTAFEEKCAISVCYFSTTTIWINNTVPVNQDDVVIDLTQLSPEGLQAEYKLDVTTLDQLHSLTIRTPLNLNNTQALRLLSTSVSSSFYMTTNFSAHGDGIHVRLRAPFGAQAVILNGTIVFESTDSTSVIITNVVSIGANVAFSKIQADSISVESSRLVLFGTAQIQSSIRANNSYVSLTSDALVTGNHYDIVVIGGSFNSGIGASMLHFSSATFQNSAVAFFGQINSDQASDVLTINFINCNGSFYLYTPSASATVTVSGGEMLLLPPPYDYNVFNRSIRVENGAVIKVSSSDYYLSITVATGATFYVATKGYNTVQFSTLVFEDNTGTFAFNASDAYVAVQRLILNDTTLVYDGRYVPYFSYSKTLIYSSNYDIRGRFGERKMPRISTNANYVFDVLYRSSSVSYIIITQQWSPVSWIAIPLIVLLSFLLTAGLIFVSMLCGRRSGDMDGVDFLGRSANQIGYARSSGSNGPILN